jgi:hypothetical protein
MRIAGEAMDFGLNLSFYNNPEKFAKPKNINDRDSLRCNPS